MPLPTDEKILQLSNDLLKQFDIMFGLHPGFRPAHAKGAMLSGSFTPTGQAASLSRAPHLNRPSTPVTVRFSDGRYSRHSRQRSKRKPARDGHPLPSG